MLINDENTKHKHMPRELAKLFEHLNLHVFLPSVDNLQPIAFNIEFGGG